MSCHPARIPPGWRRGVPGRCFVQSPAPARFRCRCGMGVPVLCTVKTAWLPAAASRRVTAPPVPAYSMALSSRITANRCREAASPCTVWPGVRPLQSGYSPANLLRLSSIYRYSIPQLAENRLKKCGRFLRLPHLRYSSSKISAATSARSRRVSMAVFSIMRWASASLMPLCSIR